MSAILLPQGKQAYEKADGTPAVGWKLYTWDTGGSVTPRATWSDAAQLALNTNPITLDARGECSVFFSGAYRVELRDDLGNQIWFIDGVSTLAYTDTAFRAAIALPAGADLVGFNAATAYAGPATVGKFLSDIYGRTPAEIAAGITPIDYTYAECVIDRYGVNTTPGTTDMTVAFQAAVTVAHAHGTGGDVWCLPQTYRTTATVVYPTTAIRIHLHGNGAVMKCTHNGDGISWFVDNENYSGHTIEKLTINGPNDFLPVTPGYVPPSNGSGVGMNRGTTSNAVTAYNNVLRDVTIQGFLLGINMRNAISLNVFGCTFQFNQYGVYIAGGQTNANHFFGTHIRYNRVSGIRSDGATGGALSNATMNTFHGCLIESNIAYVEGAFPDGGTPPSNNTGIYLNNSYGFIFDSCYIENHSASIYLTGGSKFNQFLRCDIYPGGSNTRKSTIYLDGAGIYSNVFDVSFHGAAATDVNLIANSAAQLYNRFTGSGINFIAANIIAPLDVDDVKPDLNYSPSFGVGIIRRPSQGYKSNVAEGTNPGEIEGIGTASGKLNAGGLGEIQFDTGITGHTTIDEIVNVYPGQLLVLRNSQAAYTVTLKHVPGSIQLLGGKDFAMSAAHDSALFVVGGNGVLYEVSSRNRATSAYTRSATIVESRTLAANASATAANNNSVLAALIADLQIKGVIS